MSIVSMELCEGFCSLTSLDKSGLWFFSCTVIDLDLWFQIGNKPNLLRPSPPQLPIPVVSCASLPTFAHEPHHHQHHTLPLHQHLFFSLLATLSPSALTSISAYSI